MLFNSFEFIFLFLPLTTLLYFSLARLVNAEAAIGVLVVAVLILGYGLIGHFGGARLIMVIAVAVGLSLAIGHLLGGPDLHDRSALAVASIARNIGLALFIGTLSGVQAGIVPTLLAYMIVGAIVAFPYSLWIKRQLARSA